MKTQDEESSVAARDMVEAERAFSKSIAVSAIRCSLTYVLIPFVFPLVGWGAGLGPWIGLPVGIAAIIANIMSIRRFQRSDHKWKQPMTVVNVGIISLLFVLVIVDAAELLG